MKICTTKTRLTEEEALQLASRDNSGLIGTFFNKLGHVPKEVSVLQIRKFYYPYYLEAAEAKLLRRRACLPAGWSIRWPWRAASAPCSR